MSYLSAINIHAIDAQAEQAEKIYQPLLAAWMIQIVMATGWYRKTSPDKLPKIFLDDDFVALTGNILPLQMDEDGDARRTSEGYVKLTDSRIFKLLKKRLAALALDSVPENAPLFSNVEMLGEVLGLIDAEKSMLTFACALTTFRDFKNAFGSVSSHISTASLIKVLALILGLSVDACNKILRHDAALRITGLITLDESQASFEDKIYVSESLANTLTAGSITLADIESCFLDSASASNMTLADYPHLHSDIEALSAYLSQAIKQNEQGVNILFYGEPGTGKTELAKVLASTLKVKLFEVPYSDEQGDVINGENRLRAFNLCQRILLHKPNSMLIFDEVEDVFESQNDFSKLFGGGGATNGKAWMNRSLESNTTPAIWITNDEEIDPAYLRRFDYSVRFTIPPQRVREQIAQHHLGQFNPDHDWLAQIAANERISPAQLQRAAKVARISGANNFETAKKMVEQTLDRSAMLLGQKYAAKRSVQRMTYSLELINTDISAPRLVDAMKLNPSGTFCFYGPAGTGKSELARHMADEIGKPLLLRRASDILSKWVGGSEKNIANMFAQARQEEAVLVLDEADSFLSERREAKQSWEVTQVNELLTQMEAFDGIFVCTTNLMEKLDQACLRRFAFKMRFDYLNPAQRWTLFQSELARMGYGLCDEEHWQKRLCQLNKLTPGDFAVAAKQFSILDSPATAESLYQKLLEECKIKGASTHRFGFLG